MADLASNLLAFCALLRNEYGFGVGHAHAHEALRALERVGVRNAERARYALRMVFCSKAEEIERFDRAFADFFSNAPNLPERRRRAVHAGGSHPDAPPGTRYEPDDDQGPGSAQRMLHARYSPMSGRADSGPNVPDAGLAETLADAGRLIAALRLGRSRRWKPHVRGSRFDVRRTLRASLQTGGDPVRIRTLGHPLRNPRIVVFLDGSRSMSEHALPLLQFAYALCRRTSRASVFVFSTGLREITRELRSIAHPGTATLEPLGAAWGGGTRIGECLRTFTHAYSARLDADTLLVIASDGLDAGDTADLRQAMRVLRRRCAGIFWLNPHAGLPGFEPATRGMQAALPYLSALLDAKDLQSLGGAARRLRR